MHQPGITVIFYVSHHAQNSRLQSHFLAFEEEDRKKNLEKQKKKRKPFKPQTVLVHAFQQLGRSIDMLSRENSIVIIGCQHSNKKNP